MVRIASVVLMLTLYSSLVYSYDYLKPSHIMVDNLLLEDDISDKKIPGFYGFTNGSCQLDSQGTNISISNIVPGKWFIAYRNIIEESLSRFLEPFTVTFNDTSCTFVTIRHDNMKNELLMQYMCRDMVMTTDYSPYRKCYYYIKFTANRKIKHEVSQNCLLPKQVKNIIISDTDYKSFIVIKSCIVKLGPDKILMQKMHYIILVKRQLTIQLIDEILKTVEIESQINVRSFLNLYNIKSVSKRCQCKNDEFCKSPKRTCGPFSWIKHIFLISMILLSVTFIISGIYGWLKLNNKKVNKVAPSPIY